MSNTDIGHATEKYIRLFLSLSEEERVSQLLEDDHAIQDYQTVREVRTLSPGRPASITNGSWGLAYPEQHEQDEYVCECGATFTTFEPAKNHLKRVATARVIATEQADYQPVSLEIEQSWTIDQPEINAPLEVVVEGNTKGRIWGDEIWKGIFGRVEGLDSEWLTDSAQQRSLPSEQELVDACKEPGDHHLCQADLGDETIGVLARVLEATLRTAAGGGDYDLSRYTLWYTDHSGYLLSGPDDMYVIAEAHLSNDSS